MVWLCNKSRKIMPKCSPPNTYDSRPIDEYTILHSYYVKLWYLLIKNQIDCQFICFLTVY